MRRVAQLTDIRGYRYSWDISASKLLFVRIVYDRWVACSCTQNLMDLLADREGTIASLQREMKRFGLQGGLHQTEKHELVVGHAITPGGGYAA